MHRRRAAADAIIVGTGTVFVDDPVLTARLPDGTLAERQPLRVVVGEREISSEARVLNDDSRTMVIRTRDPHEVIKALSDRTDVLLEGGPTLAGAFLRAGAIDRILAYVAPILLGGPITAVDDVGVLSIAHAQRWRFDGIEPIGPGPAAQPRPGLNLRWCQRAHLIELVAHAPVRAQSTVAGPVEVRGLHRERPTGRLDALVTPH